MDKLCLSCRDKSGFFIEYVCLAVLQYNYNSKIVIIKASEKYLNSASDTLMATNNRTPTYKFFYGSACAGYYFNNNWNCSLLNRLIS